MTTKVRRRLTTLLCADVEGYARLMEADEAGTLATLRKCKAAPERGLLHRDRGGRSALRLNLRRGARRAASLAPGNGTLVCRVSAP